MINIDDILVGGVTLELGLECEVTERHYDDELYMFTIFINDRKWVRICIYVKDATNNNKIGDMWMWNHKASIRNGSIHDPTFDILNNIKELL